MLLELAIDKGARQKFGECGTVPELAAVHTVSILGGSSEKGLLTLDTCKVFAIGARNLANLCVTDGAVTHLSLCLINVSTSETRFWRTSLLKNAQTRPAMWRAMSEHNGPVRKNSM